MKRVALTGKFIFVALVLIHLGRSSPAFAQGQSNATQQLTGRINSGEIVYYDLPDLKQWQTVYILMEATSDNLDPFLGILDDQIDLENLQPDIERDLLVALNSSNTFQAINDVRDKYYLVWDDDSGDGYAAALQFTVPEDGEYTLVASASNTTIWDTFGDYRLSLGIDAPDVLSGSTKNTALIALRNDKVSPNNIGVETFTGTLTGENPSRYYHILPKKAGDRLYLSIESTSGELVTSLFLTDFGGKVVTLQLPEEDKTSTTLEYTFTEDSSDYKLGLIGCCGDYRLLAGLNAPEVLSGQVEVMGVPILEAPMPVSIGLRLQQITEVNQKEENFGAVATLRMTWKDPGLAYSPEECRCVQKTYTQKNFNEFIQSSGGHWPEFTFFNQQDNRWIQNQLFEILPDGSATYLERFTTNFQAPDFDFKKFPFDKQQFYMHIDGIFSEDTYIFQDDPLFTEIGSQLGEEEWTITDSGVTISSEEFSTATLTSRYSFGFKATRNLSFYLIRIFLPIGIVIIVSWFSFFLKDFSKRVDVAGANLLLFIAFNFTISNDLPRLGYITFMDAILISTFVITAFVVVFNVILKRLEVAGKVELANRLDTPMIWLYPLSYVLAVVLIVWYFFSS